MLWLFLKSSNNSCLLLNMKDNLSESCFQNSYTVWVVTSLATASLLSSGKVFIQISKWTHFANLASSSCTSVAIELIDYLFMWHRHKWTLACFCMPSACSMQSIFDLVHTLLCYWTVNLWMFFVWSRHNRMCTGLSLLSIRAGPLMITICCDPTTIVDWGVVLTTTKVFIAETSLQ